MPIKTLLKACSVNYTNKCCNNCNNTCYNSCEQCLQHIHSHKDLRRYNCSNITNYYVGKFLLKYSSELQYLLITSGIVKTLSQFNILAIGCGPCTDLFAFDKLNSVHKKKILYHGVELNKMWKPIHKEIERIYNNSLISLRFTYNDIFKVHSSALLQPHHPNIITLQYLISDLKANLGDKGVKNFISNLISDVIAKIPSKLFILINDINHNTAARDYFEYFASELKSIIPNTVVKERCYFENNIKSFTFPYGMKYMDNSVKTNVNSQLRALFTPYLSCSSAQMLIEVN